eukprot:5649717-Prorocentrum_lima.AAC.1
MYCPASCGESGEAARAAAPSRPQKHWTNNKRNMLRSGGFFVCDKLSESSGLAAWQLPHLQRPQN